MRSIEFGKISNNKVNDFGKQEPTTVPFVRKICPNPAPDPLPYLSSRGSRNEVESGGDRFKRDTVVAHRKDEVSEKDKMEPSKLLQGRRIMQIFPPLGGLKLGSDEA